MPKEQWHCSFDIFCLPLSQPSSVGRLQTDVRIAEGNAMTKGSEVDLNCHYALC